jgi:hypothetical protein
VKKAHEEGRREGARSFSPPSPDSPRQRRGHTHRINGHDDDNALARKESVLAWSHDGARGSCAWIASHLYHSRTGSDVDAHNGTQLFPFSLALGVLLPLCPFVSSHSHNIDSLLWLFVRHVVCLEETEG